MIFKWRLTAWAKGLTLEQIGQQVGKDRTYMSRVSRGLAKADESLKARIAETVGMPTEKAWRKVNG
jgi:hypothetical protein